MKHALLICCHNRIEITRQCLSTLASSDLSDIDVYVLDDASSDGTTKMIESQFPWVNLHRGNGSLFWSRGMSKLWEIAALNEYDFYIWLNDDVRVHQNWRAEIFDCADLTQHKAIVSGIITSSENEVIYGGSDSSGLLQPNGAMQSIRNLNGNLTLIPKLVFDAIGGLDPVFHHDIGDVEYGYRAQRHGFKVLTSRSALGTGYKNNICRVRKPSSTISERFRRLYSPLGSPPLISFYFRRKYFGITNACAYFLYLHLINALPDYMLRKLTGERYFPQGS